MASPEAAYQAGPGRALEVDRRFYRTRQLQAAHVSTFDRLWSTLPFLRPLATITSDSLASYGVDWVGGRVHDLLGTRCDPYVNRILSGADFDFHCHSKSHPGRAVGGWFRAWRHGV